MLENNFWSGSPEGLSLDSGDTNLIQEIANFACTDAKLSNNCFLDNNIMSSSGNALYGNVMFDDKLAARDSSFSRFQLGDLTPTNNKFCAGEEEQKDSTNLLYHGWPDIGNLEDVEKMFSCDSTYGQGSSSYDNEVSWLSSPVDSSDDALRSSFNSSISEWKSTSKQSEGNTEYLCSSVTPSSTNFGKQNVFDSCWTNSQNLGADDSSSACPSFCNMVDIDVEDRRLSISNEQVSAFALGHAPMEMSPNFPPEIPPSMILEENIAKHNQHEHMQVSYTTAYQHEDSVIQQAQSQTSLTDKVPVGEKLHQSLNAVELLSIEVPAVSDTSTVPGNPCDSTFLDDVSVEASGLRQLLWIMKQLDSRTKLCIRDSLYRLARSADQRHNLGLSKSSGRDIINEKGVFTTEEANVSSELKDLEAVTNPIDRSVAHLLFQVPAKPATGVCDGSLSLESSSVVQGAITSQHLIPYELLYEEKHSGGVEEISEY
ncbi:hypothetical protein C5167_017733 [Papaver somniferum]|uniref:Protein LNK1 n=1 Tax=Papaver somniferum TaxID=3469 RepID=A0A4Y7INK9_PAPSO|nr:uncharacterized protein LOC113347522 isoform X1 [Papaver somniferum]XP_026446984.1 uncharacterized protein LOC113347522 isoform X1 [Papaver somniferum]XP_026446985.1 uncharacterized protein LOC113347522 isoform X1 [Papaver somniferum]RZC49311.1 hypothetical protein C5167_017733 [Papaver somniferum]